MVGIEVPRIAESSNPKLNSIPTGYTASIIGTTLGQPSFISYFALDTRKNGTDLIATTNGLFQTGGVIGTLLLPWISDRYGRKWGIAVSAILAIISGAVLAGSTNIAEFIVFRLIAGASAFMILAAVPIWMNEVVPVDMRGGLVDIHAVFLILGYTIQGWVCLESAVRKQQCLHGDFRLGLASTSGKPAVVIPGDLHWRYSVPGRCSCSLGYLSCPRAPDGF